MFKQKAISYPFSVVLFIFMLFLMPSKISADFYDPEKNFVIEDSVKIDRDSDTIEFDIQYQNGITDISISICDTSISNCSLDEGSGQISIFYVHGKNGIPIINKGGGTKLYELKLNTRSLGADKEGEHLSDYPDNFDSYGRPDNKYRMGIQVTFCAVKDESGQIAGGCSYTNEDLGLGVRTFEYIIDLSSGGITGDSKVNDTVAKILNVLNNIVIPVLWAAMAIILVVRGVMLGMDVVKSADEPDVRKNKVNGLIWLFVGVGAGYAVTIIASVVMTTFGFGGIFS